MRIFNYAESGEFISESLADESPLEPGVFLIPAYATDIEPPVFVVGQQAVFSAGAWALVDIPPPPAPPVPPVPTAAQTAQAALGETDATALRCFKAGVAFPPEWIAYVAALRAIVRGGPGPVPARPAYPAGT